jgi:hypothetical protein
VAPGAGYFVIGMHIIIGMPPHDIIIGAPMAIIELMASQRSFMRGIIAGSVGIIFIIMPSFVISQDILHVIGIMPVIIMGIIIGIMPIMPPIGVPPIIGMPIMPGIIIGMDPIGIMPAIIGMLPIGMLLIGMPIIEPLIGIAFIEPSSMEPFGWPSPCCIEPFGVRAFTARTVAPSAIRIQRRRLAAAPFPLP